jgi:hypothetical protein
VSLYLCLGRFHVRVCIGCLSVCVCGRFDVRVCALGVSVCVCGRFHMSVCVPGVFLPVFNVHKYFSFHVNVCLGCLALL